MKKIMGLITIVLLLTLQSNAVYGAWNSLGAIVNGSSTSFKIWSPDTANVKLYAQESSGGNFQEYSLTKESTFKDDGGFEYTDVYSATIPQNLSCSE